MTAKDRAMAFCHEMRDDGFPALVVYVDEDEAIRMALPRYPVSVVVKMLDEARRAYVAQMPPDDTTLN